MEKQGFLSRMKSSTADTGSKRIIIGVGALIVAAVAYSVFSSPAPVANPSTVLGPPKGVKTVQGGNEVSPAYNEALATADRQRRDAAIKNGDSAMPTVRASRQDQVIPVLDLDPPVAAPPAVDLPVVQQPVVLQQPLTAAVPIVEQPRAVRNTQDTKNLQDYMLGMRRGYAVAEVIPLSTGELPVPEGQTPPPAVPQGPANGAPVSKVKLPLAGTIIYAEMTSRANSDAPGPVLARILQGEYEGATLIGSFKTVQNALVISFDRMTVKTNAAGDEINETVPIDTVAVDTAYVGTALATSVDRHLFQKLAIGFTAGFAQGFGEALANSGQTTITNENGTVIHSSSDLNPQEQLLSAGGKAVSKAGDVLMDEYGKRPTTVIVESGTAIGVLFL